MKEQQQESKAISIFYCYSHKDQELRDELHAHLGPLLRSGRITTWYDGQIVPGTPWEEKITHYLDEAHIILLLISADFINSDYCYSVEMVRALERQKAGLTHVLPILIRPVDWQATPLASLQILPSKGKPLTLWPNRDEAFEEVARHLKASSRFQNTVIVILSRYDGQLDRLKGRLAGAKDFHPKPFSSQNLVALINRHIGPPNNSRQDDQVRS